MDTQVTQSSGSMQVPSDANQEDSQARKATETVRFSCLLFSLFSALIFLSRDHHPIIRVFILMDEKSPLLSNPQGIYGNEIEDPDAATPNGVAERDVDGDVDADKKSKGSFGTGRVLAIAVSLGVLIFLQGTCSPISGCEMRVWLESGKKSSGEGDGIVCDEV